MCGIYGYLDRIGSQLSQAKFNAMGTTIRHRGPDDQGSFFQKGMGVGNERLSILDVEQGHQPFVSESGDVVVVQNGEIFNFVELRQELAREGIQCHTRCDTEVILRLYERHGAEFAHKLNGMFAIAICDVVKEKIYLIRDRVGEKPLYIFDDGKTLLFASEIKSLLSVGIPRELDRDALNHFLTYNYVPPPKTIFRGITHIEPGCIAELNRTGVHVRRWWELADQTVEQKTEQAWIEEFNSILEDAVRLRLRSDVPFGAFLSGGVDSSSVVGLMSAELEIPIKTFCIGFDDKRFDESSYAKVAADRFGTEHTTQIVDANMFDTWPSSIYYCDQPHGDVSFLPMRRLSELASRDVKMVLTGDGGDELFAGYTKYRDFFQASENRGVSDPQFQRGYYKNISLFDDEGKSTLLSRELTQGLMEPDSFSVVQPLFQKARDMDRVNQALYIDMMILLAGNNLVKPDRMAMSVSLETRAPFLDFRMMEMAFRMPGEFKLRGNVTKYLFKKAVAPLISDDLAYRAKQMFTVPVGEWFKNELANLTKSILCSKRTQERGLFEPERVEQIFERHRSGIENNTREIRALMAVEIWHRVFLDRSDLTEPPSLAAML